ncbi:MAG TPA: hypothetical protein VFT72_04820 [Opitutaceae bacterium]|nr:hypothetical protein [Opitutaceae bacterium]
MDDTLLLRDNTHLGHSLHAFSWGVTDFAFGRRWLPGTWTLANVFSGYGVLGFRLGSFVLGLAVVLSALRLFETQLPTCWALSPALLFACSPLRMEVFGWSIGFIYAATALCCIWAVIWYLQNRSWLSSIAAIVALLIYPQAAGLVVLLAWLYRGRSEAYILWASLIYVLVVDVWLRCTVGYVPVQVNFGNALVVLPHYVFAFLMPLGSVPIVPAGWHWGVFVGVAVLGIVAGRWPMKLSVWLLIASPLVLASVTESFWFAGRYSTLPALAALFFLSPAFVRVKVRWIGVLFVCVFCVITARDSGFRSQSDCLRRACDESVLLYGRNDARTVSIADIPGRLRAAAVARGVDQNLSLVQKP